MKSITRLLTFALILGSLFTLASCDEDQESRLVIALGGITNKTELYSGEVLEVSIYVTAPDNTLTHFTIESFNSTTGNAVLLDRELTGHTQEFKYYYTAPQIATPEADVRLSFTATDNTGYRHTITRDIKILRREQQLEERSGVILYCEESNGTHPDGYSFAEMRPLIVSLVDPSIVDLYVPEIDPADLPDPDDMPKVVREWRSMTDMEFARNNSFDFSNATSINIAAGYESSIRAPRITNLTSGDVVLVGRGTEPVAAIQVVDVIVGETLAQSRFVLNIKAIKSETTDKPAVDEPEDPDASGEQAE